MAEKQELTAAILIVGSEILSGRTQDVNIQFIANRLSLRGIRLCEVRVVSDVTKAVVEALDALRTQYTYVFSTGGIGPTHDDITAACVAQAFGVPVIEDAEARRRLAEYYAPKGVELNEARLKMARIPKGSTLIDNPVSAAPGFKVGNVFVMAGVPKIMQSMFTHVEQMIGRGAPLVTRTIVCKQREGEIAADLDAIQAEFPDIEIGSYPQPGGDLSIALRGTDEIRLEAAVRKAAEMVKKRGEEPVFASA